MVNNDIPMCPAPLGIWDKVSAFGGDALGNLLGFGSELFTTNLIIGACSAQTAFTGDWMRTSTSTSFWTIFRAVLSSTPPAMRCVACSTWYPC